MTFIFYDTETTGLTPAFDQILQFAATVTDDSFNILEEVDYRCRLLPHVLPSPGAMAITGMGPQAIQTAPMSCCEMITAIRALIQKWSPAVLIGFNSIGYDEDMLRQAFYQHLHPVYLTNTGGNSRMDALILAHAVAAHGSNALNVPVNDKGRPSFRLGKLIEANGLTLDHAHDALFDTRATLALTKYLREKAPGTWDALFACRSKALVADLLAANDFVLFTDRHFRNPTIVASTICASPEYSAAYAMFDLSYDPASYLDLNVESAIRLFKTSPRPIRILKANKLPIVRAVGKTEEFGVDTGTAKARVTQIRAHPTFAGIIATAMAGRYDNMEPAQYIEQQIYGGFPSPKDALAMARFHSVPWEERYALSQSFEDSKYRELAERIIFAEQPNLLPAKRQEALAAWCHERRQAGTDVPWMTIAKMKAELEELRASSNPSSTELLSEITSYIEQLEIQ